MNPWSVITAAAAAAALALLLRRSNPPELPAGMLELLPRAPVGGDPDAAWMPSADPTADTMPDQLPSLVEAAGITLQEAASDARQAVAAAVGLAAPEPPPDQAERNLRAFLDMIATAEGTAGPNGYRTLFGGALFDGYADHPRQFATFTDRAGRTQRTSAAGRYQFLSRTWDELQRALDLPDFSPASQDSAAIELIRRRGALADVKAGRVADAVAKVAPIWASLPGAGYAQPERQLSTLVAAFEAAGGNLGA